jgi:hypothetical protein
MSTKKKKLTLTPPDKRQCQAEIPNGCNFMTLGGRPERIRCSNKPTILATETAPGLDGLIGSMTLCDACFAVFQRQMPKGFAVFKHLRAGKNGEG